jgi:hypothetical protein
MSRFLRRIKFSSNSIGTQSKVNKSYYMSDPYLTKLQQARTIYVASFLALLVISLMGSSALINARVNSTAGTDQTVPSDFLTYDNSTYGVKIQYPPDWDLREPFNTPGTYTEIADFSPPISSDKNANTVVALSVTDLIQKRTLGYLIKNAIGLFRGANDTSNFKVVDATTDALLGGQKAFSLIYTSTTKGLDEKTMLLGSIFGNRLYQILYTSEPSKFDLFLPAVNKMVGSLIVNQTS